VQVGDTAQKQALDATVALTNSAMAGSQGYVAEGYVPARAGSSAKTGGGGGGGSGGGGGGGSGSGLGGGIGAGELRGGEFDSDVPPCHFAGETGCLSAAVGVPLCRNDCGKYLATLRQQGVTEYDGEGVCDDGGEGSEWGACALGSDCDDCGPREWEESMEDSPAIAGGDGSDSERGMTESDVRGANGGGSASGGGGVAQPSQQGKTAVQSNPTLGTISTLSGMLGESRHPCLFLPIACPLS